MGALFQRLENVRKTISNLKKLLEPVCLHSVNTWTTLIFPCIRSTTGLIQEGNRYIQVEQPWKLMKIGQEDVVVK